jgi:hypothetical protein
MGGMGIHGKGMVFSVLWRSERCACGSSNDVLFAVYLPNTSFYSSIQVRICISQFAIRRTGIFRSRMEVSAVKKAIASVVGASYYFYLSTLVRPSRVRPVTLINTYASLYDLWRCAYKAHIKIIVERLLTT